MRYWHTQDPTALSDVVTYFGWIRAGSTIAVCLPKATPVKVSSWFQWFPFFSPSDLSRLYLEISRIYMSLSYSIIIYHHLSMFFSGWELKSSQCLAARACEGPEQVLAAKVCSVTVLSFLFQEGLSTLHWLLAWKAQQLNHMEALKLPETAARCALESHNHTCAASTATLSVRLNSYRLCEVKK